MKFIIKIAEYSRHYYYFQWNYCCFFTILLICFTISLWVTWKAAKMKLHEKNSVFWREIPLSGKYSVVCRKIPFSTDFHRSNYTLSLMNELLVLSTKIFCLKKNSVIYISSILIDFLLYWYPRGYHHITSVFLLHN